MRYSNVLHKNLATLQTMTVPANGRRVALRFVCRAVFPTSADIYLDSVQSNNLVLSLSYVFPAQELTIEKHGDLVQRRFVLVGFPNTGSQPFTAVEVTEIPDHEIR